MTLPRAILIDLDGTLCDHRHRLHFVERTPTYGIPKYNRIPDFHSAVQIPDPEPPKDYESFYAEIHKDTPNECVAEILISVSNRYESGVICLFLTGRPERYFQTTQKWLLDHHLFNQGDRLLMRPDYSMEPVLCGDIVGQRRVEGDYRPAHVVKAEIYAREIQGKYEVMFCLDDDELCCEMYKSLGLQVLRVM